MPRSSQSSALSYLSRISAASVEKDEELRDGERYQILLASKTKAIPIAFSNALQRVDANTLLATSYM